jgi:hypothetical protein
VQLTSNFLTVHAPIFANFNNMQNFSGLKRKSKHIRLTVQYEKLELKDLVAFFSLKAHYLGDLNTKFVKLMHKYSMYGYRTLGSMCKFVDEKTRSKISC